MPFRKLGEPLFSLGMGQRLGLGNRNSGASLEYWQNLQALFGSSIIAYYPMWDLTGTVMTDIQNGRNGAYQGTTGVLLNQTPLHGNKPSVFVDATNSWCRITNAAALAAISTALTADWSIMFDYKPLSINNWAAGAPDSWLMRWQVDANNLVEISNPSGDANLYFRYIAGGTTNQVTKPGAQLDANSHHFCITGSKANDRFRVYYDGAQQGADVTGLGNFAGALAYAVIGEYAAAAGAGGNGWFQNFLILNKEATPAEVASANSFSLPAVAPPEAGGFTIIFIPDTQALVQTPAYRSGFTEIMNWIISNKAALNIQAVVTEGDVVETVGIADEWVAADSSYGVLDTDGTIPYLVTIGDHDYDTIATHDSTTFNGTFPQARYTGQSWWAGGFYEVGRSENAYNIVTIGGVDYLFVSVETSAPRAGVLTWLDALLTTHSAKKAIITTHAYLQSNDTRDANGASIWAVLKLHDNVIWVSCGNYVTPDGYGRLTSQTDGGKDVHQVLFDTQSEPYGGPWLRVVKFNPGNNIVTETYSPVSRIKKTDGDNEFTLNFPS